MMAKRNQFSRGPGQVEEESQTIIDFQLGQLSVMNHFEAF